MVKSCVPVTFALGLLIVSTGVGAQPGAAVPSPTFKVGDAWVFDDVFEKGASGYNQVRSDMVVERLGEATMTIGIKHDGAPTAMEDHIVGTDWSQRRLVDGRETVTTRPYDFPLTVGHKWTVDFVDSTRRGNQLSVHVHQSYTVVGWEDVTVPAGHFHAVKVVSEGIDEATIETLSSAGANVVASSGGSVTTTHAQRGGIGKLQRVTHGEFYYAPDVRSAVKSIEEQYNTDNVRVSRQTRTLVSFTPAA